VLGTRTLHFDNGVTLRHVGFALALDAGEAGAKKWQKVFPLGETRHRSDFGSITFDRDFLEAMVRNYRAEGSPPRPWDYFHRGSSDDSQVRNEDKVAAGWFHDVELRADGLYVLTEWTAKAAAAIDAKELQFPSPTFTENAMDPKTGKPCGPKLFAVALLNDPFLTDLPPVQAAANPAAPKGQTMKLQLAALVAAAKLNADTTEDTVEAALKAKADELDAAKAEIVTLKSNVEKASKDAEALKLAQADNVKLSDRLTKLEAQAAASAERALAVETAQLCSKLQSEGRIVAAEKSDVEEDVKTFGLEKATARWAKRPVVVALGERGVTGAGTEQSPEGAKQALDKLTEELAKKDGITLGDARIRVLAMSENRALVDAASKLVSPKN
jgi:phage I-like protein